MKSHVCLICGSIKNENIHLFKFPKSEDRCKLWLEKCHLESVNTKNVKNAYLCKRHFGDNDFSKSPNDPSLKRLRLKKTSVPSVFDLQNISEETSAFSSENQQPSHKVTHSCIICGFVPSTSEKISYFRFPKDKALRKEWTDKFQIDPSINLNDVRLCSRHFTSDENPSIHRRQRKIFAETNVDYGTIKKHVRPKNLNLPADEGASDIEDQPSNLHTPGEIESMVVEPEQPSFLNIQSSTFCPDRWENLFENPDEFSSVADHSSGFQSGNNECVTENSDLLFPEFIHSSVGESYGHRKNASTQTCSQIIDFVEDKLCASNMTADTSSLEITLEKTPPVCTISGIMETPKFVREHCYGQKKNKVRSQPRYPNDIGTPHIQTPRIARKSLSILKNSLQKQQKTIKDLRQRLRRSQQKIENLEMLVSNLKSCHFVTDDVAQLLMVSN